MKPLLVQDHHVPLQWDYSPISRTTVLLSNRNVVLFNMTAVLLIGLKVYSVVSIEVSSNCLSFNMVPLSELASSKLVLMLNLP